MMIILYHYNNDVDLKDDKQNMLAYNIYTNNIIDTYIIIIIMMILLIQVTINVCNLIFDWYIYCNYKEMQIVNLLPALHDIIMPMISTIYSINIPITQW